MVSRMPKRCRGQRGQSTIETALVIVLMITVIFSIFEICELMYTYSVIADAAIAVTGRYAAERLVGGEVWWHIAQLLVSTLVLTALFAGVFRTLAQGG